MSSSFNLNLHVSLDGGVNRTVTMTDPQVSIACVLSYIKMILNIPTSVHLVMYNTTYRVATAEGDGTNIPPANKKWFNINSTQKIGTLYSRYIYHVIDIDTSTINMSYVPNRDLYVDVQTMLLANPTIINEPLLRIIDVDRLMLPPPDSEVSLLMYQRILYLYERLKIPLNIKVFIRMAPCPEAYAILLLTNRIQCSASIDNLIKFIVFEDDSKAYRLLKDRYFNEITQCMATSCSVGISGLMYLLSMKSVYNKIGDFSRGFMGFSFTLSNDNSVEANIALTFMVSRFFNECANTINLYTHCCREHRLTNKYMTTHMVEACLTTDQMASILCSVVDNKKQLKVWHQLDTTLHTMAMSESSMFINNVGYLMNDSLYRIHKPQLQQNRFDEYLKYSVSPQALIEYVTDDMTKKMEVRQRMAMHPREELFLCLLQTDTNYVHAHMHADVNLITLPRFNDPVLLEQWYNLVSHNIRMTPDVLLNSFLSTRNYLSLKIFIDSGTLTRTDILEYIKFNLNGGMMYD